MPCVLALGASLPLYEPLWKALPPLRFARVPERLMPIACLAIAALVAHAVALCVESTQSRAGAGRSWRRAWSWRLSRCSRSTCGCRCSAPSRADTPNAAYAAIGGDGRLLELPVFRPDIHFGSVGDGLRAAVAARAAARLLDDCAAGGRPARSAAAAALVRSRHDSAGLGIRFVVVHRGLYEQSGFFAAGCAARAEAALRRAGWHLLARDGAISSWERP